MSYIWENYDLNTEYRLALKNFSPYLEIGFSDQYSLKKNVNGFYRFFSIFQKLLLNEKIRQGINEAKKADKDWYESENINCLFHILANFDRLSGLGLRELRMLRICKRISNSMYGEKVKDVFFKLGFRQQYIILLYLAKKEEEKNRKSYFANVITEIFGREENGSFSTVIESNTSSKLDSPLVYFLKKENKFLTYVDRGKEDFLSGSQVSNEDTYLLLKFFFLDLCPKERIFWRYHFGIIGDNSKMQINKIGIY